MDPVTGGEPIQVTSGAGPDHGVGVSSDGKRAIYMERQGNIGHIRLVDLTTGETHQLTTEDWMRSTSSMSPSGTRIAFSQQMIDAASMVMDIYTMRIDGSEIRKITDDKNLKYPLAWSPDERWIAYCGRPTNEPQDSNRIYIVSADKPATPQMVGKGSGLMWFNEREFVVRSAMATYKGSLDRPGYERFSEDSVWAVPIFNQKYVLIGDLHQRRRGWSITSAQSYRSAGTTNARPLLKVPAAVVIHPSGTELFYVAPATGELHRVLLTSGNDELVRVNLPGLTSSNYATDGKRLAYTVYNARAKFIVVDDPFK
jgi:WD40 repeat protein